MVAQVLPIVGEMITSVIDLFFDVINRLGALGLVFGAFIVLTIHRFLLVPIIGGVVGGAQSDMVKSALERGGTSLDKDGKAGKGVKNSTFHGKGVSLDKDGKAGKGVK